MTVIRYHEKAANDIAAVAGRVDDILTKLGRPSSISPDTIKVSNYSPSMYFSFFILLFLHFFHSFSCFLIFLILSHSSRLTFM